MTPHFHDSKSRPATSSVSSQPADEENTTMERRERFVKAWNETFDGTEPPDLDFGDDSLSQRRDLCTKNLQEALTLMKREGFILKWISDVLSLENSTRKDPDLDKVLRILLYNSTGDDPKSGKDFDAESPSSSSERPPVIQENGHQHHTHISHQGNSLIFDVCDTSQGLSRVSPEGNIELKYGHVNTSDSAVSGSGSVVHVEKPSDDFQDPDASSTAELFRSDTNELDENENKGGDAVDVNESNEDPTNDGAEKVELNDCYLSTEDVVARGGIQSLSSVGILEPSAALCDSSLPLDVMSESQTTAGSNDKVKLYGENAIKCRTADLQEDYENNPPSIIISGDHEIESSETLITGSKCSEEGQKGIESHAETQQNNSDKTPSSHGNFLSHSEKGNEEQDRCEEETPGAEIEVVDDLISYLDQVELASSDEDDSPGDDPILCMARRGIRYNSDFRSRKLDSVRSVGNASIASMDSCVGGWALDLAASEMHDSSDENIIGDENTKTKRKISQKKSPGVDEGKMFIDLKGEDGDEFVPTRPPRRNKTEKRSRTMESPKRLHAVGDDDVFKREDDGYEGDKEGKSVENKAGENGVRTRSHTGGIDHRKKRKARGSDVVFDGSNIDFMSSPFGSPETSTANQNLDDYDEGDAEKLHKRKWVVSAVLDSEKGYLECLNRLVQHMRPLRLTIGTSSQVLSLSDFEKIFYKVEEIHSIHTKFYSDLEQRVTNWSIRQIIGDLFLALTFQSGVYKEYIGNYNTVLDTIHKCKANNEQFHDIFCKEVKLQSLQEVTTLEGLFSKPVDRIGRYITNFNDLIKQTPEEHPDFPLLKDVRQSTQDFLANISGDQRDGPPARVKKDHRLLKDSFIVDLVDGVRKIRHLFLFNDVLMCNKRKISGRNETYFCKWYIPMCELQFHRVEDSEGPQVVPVTSQTELDVLKGRIASTKAEIRREKGVALSRSPETSPSLRRRKLANAKVVEKLKKKLAEQEVDLLLATPSLPLTLYSKHGKSYTLLCKSDVERAEWKDAIAHEKENGSSTDQASTPVNMIEIQAMLEACKKLRACKTLGRVSLKQDKTLLNGLLYVHIQTGRGFHQGDLYCVLEVDHYAQFTRKAKTKTCKASTDPVWDQDFDIEIEGTKELKLLVYYKSRLKDELCGQGKIQLARENLDDFQKRTITITLDKQGAVTLSLQYSNTAQGIERKKSLSEKGVFGVDLATVARREASDIPLIVIGCVQEIEKRGLDEVGIYRLSGASTDLRKLKEAFDENSQSALVQVAESDIHAVAGLLKMYLRDLPEPLFTDRLYHEFVKAKAITDEEERKKMMIELFQSLETPNRLTAIYLVEHLRLVSMHEESNKMGMNNLATVFGPNVLRPSSTGSGTPMDLAQGTLNVMSQVSIFLYILKLDSDVTRLPKDRPALLRRLDPRKISDSSQPDFSANKDRLI